MLKDEKNINLFDFKLSNFSNGNLISEKDLQLYDIIDYISEELTNIIVTNKQQKRKQKGPKDPLYAKLIPSMSINDYIKRIVEYTECENIIIYIIYIYIQRLIINENFVLTRNNVYKVLLGCYVLTAKFYIDNKYSNSVYCQLGGLSLTELNLVEYSLFVRLNYKLFINEQEIIKIKKDLIWYKNVAKLNEKTNNIVNSLNNKLNLKGGETESETENKNKNKKDILNTNLNNKF